VIARLQIYINSGSPSLFTRFAQGKDFGMGLTRTWMKPFPDNLAIPNNYRTHQRIGGCSSEGAAGKFNTPLHHSAIKGHQVRRRR
jgi:hypothetical protein